MCAAPASPAPPIPVSLSTASVYPRKCQYAFEIAAELGYDGIEVMVWQDDVTQDARALGRLSEHSGIPVVAIHAPTLLVSRSVWGRAPGQKLRKSVELARDLAAGTVVVHPPFRWQYRYAREFANQVRTFAVSTGVTVAVENMFPWRSGNRSLQAYLPGWDPADHDYDAVTLDFSHAAIAHQDPRTLLDVFGDRLRHVHLADGTGNGRDEHLVPGRGTQPCAEVLTMLSDRRWRGNVVVEISTRRARLAADRRQDLAESLEFARKHLG